MVNDLEFLLSWVQRSGGAGLHPARERSSPSVAPARPVRGRFGTLGLLLEYHIQFQCAGFKKGSAKLEKPQKNLGKAPRVGERALGEPQDAGVC